jgi:glycolate oxidase FAD binding subunit
MMVGSLGRFGVMVELTFKVFPKPESYATLVLDAKDASEANTLMQKLANASLEPYALEFLPPKRLLVRFGGLDEALTARLERVQAYLAQAGEVLLGDAEERLWQDARAFTWVPDAHALVKVAHSPRLVTALEGTFHDLPRRYSVGGNVLYLAWPEGRSSHELDTRLKTHNLAGLALTGTLAQASVGTQTGGAFLERVTRVFDPHGIFSPDVTHAA